MAKVRLRGGLIATLLCLPVTAIAADTAPVILVPSNPSATYRALAVTRTPAGHAIITAQRQGSSGTSYTVRECTCRGGWRYLAQGSDLKAMTKSEGSEPFDPVGPQGTIARDVCSYACAVPQPAARVTANPVPARP